MAAIAAGVAWLGTRAHHGIGKLPAPAPKAAPSQATAQVDLCQSCAHDFDPVGDKAEHPNEVGLTVDGQLDTKWTTESYFGSQSRQGRRRRLRHDEPGDDGSLLPDHHRHARLLGSDLRAQQHTAADWPDSGWHLIGTAARVKHRQDIPLNSGTREYGYYLMWITNLHGINQVAINELALYR